MLKASVAQRPESTTVSLREFFGSSYVGALANLDFFKPSRSNLTSEGESANEFQQFVLDLTRTLDRYAMYLEADLVELIEKLVGSPVGIIVKLRPGIRIQAPFSHPTVRPILADYCTQFAALAEAYNAIETEERLTVRPSDEVWREDVMPAIGSAMMNP